MSKTPEILCSATRQYKHNNEDESFVIAFEQEETIKIVERLQDRITEIEQQVNALESGRDYLSGEYEILQKKNDELERQLAQERVANRWIPVTESIPKEQGVYLVSFHNGVNSWFECCELCFTHSLVFNNLIKHGATHWMKTQEVK